MISNAMKFTSKGSITTEVDFDHVNKQLVISVVDTGIGIRKADQLKLFKMFGKLQSSSK